MQLAMIARILTAVLVALPVSTASAQIFNYAAPQMTGDNEVPPVATTAIGAATFEWNAATGNLVVAVIVQGIDLADILSPSPLHIHGPATESEIAGVVLPLGTDADWRDLAPGPGIGFGYDEILTGNEFAGLNCTPGPDCLDAFQELLDDQMAYINFHTVQNIGGELRDQIMPVPEPSAAALGVAALAAIGLTRRLREPA